MSVWAPNSDAEETWNSKIDAMKDLLSTYLKIYYTK